MIKIYGGYLCARDFVVWLSFSFLCALVAKHFINLCWENLRSNCCGTLCTDDRFIFKSAKMNCNFVGIIAFIHFICSFSLVRSLSLHADGVIFFYTFLIDAIISLHNSFLILLLLFYRSNVCLSGMRLCASKIFIPYMRNS